MKHLTAFLCALLASAVQILAAEKPNIVFIPAEDLGYGNVQCLNPGRGKNPTPRVDKMASQGMTFTDAHTSSSICTPTRYSLLTGHGGFARANNGMVYQCPQWRTDRQL